MALEKQTLNIATAQGLDTKSDPKQEGKGFFVTLANAVFRTISELRKRYGFDVIPATIIPSGSITVGTQIAALNNELIESDSTSLYSNAITNGNWINRGPMPIVNYTTQPITRNGYNIGSSDSCTVSGYQLFAWIEGATNTLKCSVIDTATGTVILSSSTVAASASSVKVVAITGAMLMFYADNSGGKVIYLSWVTIAAPTTVNGPTSLVSDMSTSQWFDVTVISAVASRAYFSYMNDSGGGGGITSYYLNTSFALSSAYTLATADSPQTSISVWGDATGNLWTAYATAAAVKVFITNPALTTPVLAKTTIEAVTATQITGVVSSTTATIFYKRDGSSAWFDFIRKNTLTVSGTVGTAADFIRQNSLASKAFLYSGVIYVMTLHDSPLQPTYFLLTSTGVCVARVAQSVSGTTYGYSLPNANAISTGVYQVSFQQADLLLVASGTVFSQKGVQSVTYTINGATTIAQQLASEQHFTGGMLQMYDGNVPCEHGFHLSPENITGSTGTSGSLTAGVYGVKVCYEWMDAQGQIHRSAPSAGNSFTIGAIVNGSIALTIPTLPITLKTGGVRIMVYYTAPNGTVYYAAVASPSSATLNNTATDTVSVSITAPDPSGNSLLYTTGGEVDNDPMQPGNLITTFKSRMIANVIGSPLQYQYSKQVITGTPVEFSADFVGNIDSKILSFTAGAALDGNFIFFGPTNIFYMVGDGPSPNGVNNDFSTPQLVSSDAGCANQNSVVLMPNGLMFQTPSKGIYLLDRSLQVSYIGSPVAEFNSYTVTSAVLVKNQNQVRFTISNGTVLSYDYFVGQWANQTGISAVGATIWNSKYVFLRSSAVAYQENTSSYADNGSEINMTFKTGWYSFAGVQGYQRARFLLILGEYKSGHTLTVNIYYNFLTTIGQTVTIPVVADPAPYQFRIHLTQQKCESIQVEIIESNSVGFEGFSLSNLAVEVGVKKGLNKLPAAVSYG